MKITINGKISEEALKSILETQKKKVSVIDEYCKKEKLDSLEYKDSELEYVYSKEPKKPKTPVKKVEVRKNAKGN
ncbi:MAG: hypothetical protein ACVCEJ_09815 [Candidatus Izemoplasmataceae bacterium]|jgi:hypothetical protein